MSTNLESFHWLLHPGVLKIWSDKMANYLHISRYKIQRKLKYQEKFVLKENKKIISREEKLFSRPAFFKDSKVCKP